MTTTSTDRGRPPVDPRIRERRREIRRSAGRRRLRRLGAALGGAALTAAGVLVVVSPVLDVDSVVVHGAVRTGAAEVRRASGIELGAPMVTLGGEEAARAVEALPWVARARVARSWPGAVVITVEERPAAAVALGDDGRRVLIGRDGRQLAVAGVDDGHGLASIEGLGFPVAPGRSVGSGAAGALELAERLVAAFPDAPVVVAVDERGGLEARIAPDGAAGVRVVVGAPDRLADKVMALVSVVERAGDQPPPAVVDVRAPDAPALTRASP